MKYSEYQGLLILDAIKKDSGKKPDGYELKNEEKKMKMHFIQLPILLVKNEWDEIKWNIRTIDLFEEYFF